ncbi:MAG: TolC family protein [Archangiaceae bacterium]|nr:TolC family protein [Archangiaceae bacterium]
MGASLELSKLPSDAQLFELLWERAPDLQLARAKVAQARGDYDRAALLPNPQLDVSANTLPVGPSNQANAPVANAWAEVPNYGFGVSELVELGKRGPRQDATRRAYDAAVHDAQEQLRQRFFDLQEHLGEIAAAQARIAALSDLSRDAEHLTAIQRARADKGDASALDADRALLEEEKLKSTLGAEQEHLVAELRACADVLGVPCAPFEQADGAAAFLADPQIAPARSLEDRPDLKSLQATADASRAAETLANRRAIPDPTFRVGYVRDQYLASGNYPNSLYVGVSLPLPVFDHGQADARAARGAAEAAERARVRTIESAREALTRLGEQSQSIEARRRQVRERALPLARDVVARLDAAVVRGAAAVQDLLLARRTLVELLIDARDLDLSAFRNRVELSRVGGAMPGLPQELN